MCGILGIVGKPVPEARLDRLLDGLAHRGPDDAGVYRSDAASLGHRRLSIIDLSDRGRQPMHDAANGRWLVFNGEIYNYIELKRELEGAYAFKTQTDSEVILAAYARWGKDCVSRFNGMFAFAIWDEKERALFCARDRLGIKPFFYAIGPEGEFCFSSEIKPLFAMGIPREPNDPVIAAYLAHGLYYHSDETFFKGIRSLPQGSTLTCRNGKTEITPYWDIAEKARRHETRDPKKITDEFLSLLSDSVRLRLRSDVPIGLHLSAGLDSSSLFVMIDRLLEKGQEMTAYTYTFGDPKYDEDLHADSLKGLNAQWRLESVRLPEGRFWELARELTRKMESPYGGFTTVAYYHMNQALADNGVKVLFEGQGVDEILAGYAYYRTAGASGDAGTYQDGTALARADYLTPAVYEYAPKPSFPQPFDSPLLNRQYRDLRFTKLPRVLNFNDRATMAYGKELRLPFLDYRLVEFCFALPEEFKLDATHSKKLLRQAMEGLLPDAVRWEPKRAVVNPQREWLRNRFKGEVTDLFSSQRFRQRGWWDADRVLRAYGDYVREGGENSVAFWQLLNLEMWYQCFFDA